MSDILVLRSCDRRLRYGLLALLLLASVGVASAQRAETAVTRERAISAFLVNALYYGQWPAAVDWQRGKVARICVLGRDTLSASLQSVADDFQAKRFRDGRVVVVSSSNPDDLADCHVVYVSGADRELAHSAIQALATRPIILVSDANGFAERGGTFEIRVDTGKSPEWDLNLDQLAASSVQVGSQMKIRSGSFIQDGKRTPNRLR